MLSSSQGQSAIKQPWNSCEDEMLLNLIKLYDSKVNIIVIIVIVIVIAVVVTLTITVISIMIIKLRLKKTK
jgi:hypothetical protein